MSLAMFKDSPTQALRKIEVDLRGMRADIDFRRYFAMTPRQISEKIERLLSKNRVLTETLANRTWLMDNNYLYRKLLVEGLEIVRNLREDEEDREQLQDAMIYYAGTIQFGDTMKGRRCYFVEGQEPVWVKFSEKVAVQKALDVLRYGTKDDFRIIYMECADGRPDALQRIDINHIRESSSEALAQIEAYCDSRWEGPWPWEKRSSLKLQSQIEEAVMVRKQNIVEMQQTLDRAITALYEEALDKYEVVTAISDIIDQVDRMIDSIGKISASSVTATASARALVGDDVGSHIEQAVSPVLMRAAQDLSSLKVQLENAKTQVENSSGDMGGDMGMGQMGGQMGSPGDAMGAPPMGGDALGGDDLAADMASTDLGGSAEERGMKDI